MRPLLRPALLLAVCLALGLAACESADGPSPGIDAVAPADAADTAAPPLADVPVSLPDAAPDARADTPPAGVPHLRVTPADGVDFGAVAQGITTRRQVMFANDGTADLTLAALAIVPAESAAAGEFAFETPPPADIRLRPGATHARFLTFRNTRGGDGEAAAQLVVTSDDPAAPELTLPLTATRAAAPTCAAVLEPQPLDFGAVAAGSAVEATVRLRNNGSGRCGYTAAAALDCAPSEGAGGWSCPTPDPSPWFTVVVEPEASADGLGPGQTADLRVRFVPQGGLPPAAPADVAYAGYLQVTLSDPYVPAGEDDRVLVPELPPGPAAPNLVGHVPSCLLRVTPEVVDLGAVSPGCVSAAFPIEARLPCAAEALVTAVTLDPACAAAFSLELPALPEGGLAVRPGEPLLLSARFAPAAEGAAECAATIAAASGEVGTFTLRGTGAAHATVTDTFTGGARPGDVLFVIDDSGSMCDTQDRLVRDLPAFVTTARAAAADLHVGVTGVCVDPAEGCAAAGHLRSTRYAAPDWPRWVEPDALDALGAELDLGCDGPSAQEAGLQAATLALTPPLTDLTTTACADDAACAAPAECLRDLGLCGGRNAGFLRPAADLHVVILSDEDDQSEGPVEAWAQTFAALKAGVPAAAVRVHAIVGDPGTGCETAFATAAPGDRYAWVVEHTGGVRGSICAETYGDTLAAVSASVAGPRRAFDLTRVPAPETLAVTVADAPCASGWTYDAAANRVVFDPAGPCVPRTGEALAITYEAACGAAD